MKTVAIIGFGRFGKTLARLLAPDFRILVFDPAPRSFRGVKFSARLKRARTSQEALTADTVFYAVPIENFEEIIRAHQPFLRPGQTVIDTLSVKMHPAKVLKKHLLRSGVELILTHPMFGPDSSAGGFRGLPLVMHRLRAAAPVYRFWENFFERKGLTIISLTPAQHDRLAASSQGLAHFIGRLLQEFGLRSTKIDTLGAKKLKELEAQVCRDTWQLFFNLQNYNPYTKSMRLRLGRAYEHLYNRLLPARIVADRLVFGIQGGVGSFNEQALADYVNRQKIGKHEIKYLFTTPKVLRELNAGNIDYGLFAIQNATGGLVRESVAALTRYNCKIKREFSIPVRHCLMKLPDVRLKRIKQIMAHDQVFRQCRATLRKKYPRLRQVTGKGDLADTARAAQALAYGKIGRHTYILGPERLAELYGLEVVARDLQDNRRNETTFLLVSR